MREARHRRRLGDLKADLAGVDAALLKLIDDERQKLIVAETLSGKIDGTHRQPLALVGLGDQPAERVLNHPAVDVRRNTVAFSGHDEIVGRDNPAIFIAHTQQQLVVGARFRFLQRLNRHPEQLKTTFLERRIDARRPLHFTPTAHQLDVVLGKTVHAIAALFFGGLTGTVGSGNDRRHIIVVCGDRHHADAGAKPKHALFPVEAEIAHRLAQRFCHAHRFIERAALKQDTELVAAQSRQRIAPTHLRFQQRADLPKERITGAMSAAVVDDLELIDVQITKRIGRLTRLGALERALQAIFKFTPIDQTREQIVTCVVTQAPVQLARFGDIVEYQHAAGGAGSAVADRRRRALDIEFIAVAPDQQHRPHRLNGARATNRHSQWIFQRFAGLFVESAENLLHGFAHGVLKPPAGEILGHWVDVVDH